MRILIVDDYSDWAELLAEYIAFALPATTVVQANAYDTAADHLSSQSFDLVLSDINLPGGTGYDLLNELRAGRFEGVGGTRASVKVILSSGYALAIRAPVGDNNVRALPKPCLPDDVVTMIIDFMELSGKLGSSN